MILTPSVPSQSYSVRFTPLHLSLLFSVLSRIRRLRLIGIHFSLMFFFFQALWCGPDDSRPCPWVSVHFLSSISVTGQRYTDSSSSPTTKYFHVLSTYILRIISLIYPPSFFFLPFFIAPEAARGKKKNKKEIGKNKWPLLTAPTRRSRSGHKDKSISSSSPPT